LDDAGRILIPKELVQYAKIDKDIVLSSSLNKIEIWNKKLYETSITEKSENFGDLAEDVMGGINNKDE